MQTPTYTSSKPVTFTSSGTVTVTITPDSTTSANGAEPAQEVPWEGPLALEGVPTSDRRYLIPGEIDSRDMPLPLRDVRVDSGGHDQAEQVGRIDSIQHIPIQDFARAEEFGLTDLPDTAVVVWGEGVLTASGNELETTLQRIENGAGVSADIHSITRTVLLDAATLEEVDPETLDLETLLNSDFVKAFAGRISGATIVDIPAFEQASIQVVEDGLKVASGAPIKLQKWDAMLASGAPVKPPKSVFEREEPDHLVPLTVDGHEVYGHLAPWDQCHTGVTGSCDLATRSASGYALFHVGSIETAEGDIVPVGRITVGKGTEKQGGHCWDAMAGVNGAIDHYDRTGTVAAFVRATDGKHGIWLSGVLRSDATDEMIRDLRANPPSGDWRWQNGGWELVAALSVPVPGYPVPYVVATGASEPLMLIAAGYREEAPVVTRAQMRALALIVEQGEQEFAKKSRKMGGAACAAEMFQMTCPQCGCDVQAGDATCPECGSEMMNVDDVLLTVDEADAETFAYTAEQRRRMAENGQALPDGSFPIANCGDAERAIHAQGRAGNQGRAVAHIRKRVSALGCSGSIFDNYK